MITKVTSDYKNILRTFEKLCDVCIQLSINTHNRKVESGQCIYGSQIFTKFISHAIAIRKLLPESTLFNLPGNLQLWDISSIAVLVRALMETYNVFYYLTIDKVSTEEWKFRFILWRYHAECQRLKMLKAIRSVNPEITNIEINLEKLRDDLLKDPFYNLQPFKIRNKFLGGDRGIALTNSEISERAGIAKEYYKTSYAYSSNYTHSYPFSLQQLKVFKAEDEESLNLIITQIKTSSGYMCFAIRDYIKIFPDQSSLKSGVEEEMETYIHILGNIGEPM
ncbi:MAG: hypothetical protein GYA14_10840 [Ignavibacteria bacterium]|nr:hypothetical protein [Ignavibacteria bacterium]